MSVRANEEALHHRTKAGVRAQMPTTSLLHEDKREPPTHSNRNPSPESETKKQPEKITRPSKKPQGPWQDLELTTVCSSPLRSARLAKPHQLAAIMQVILFHSRFKCTKKFRRASNIETIIRDQGSKLHQRSLQAGFYSLAKQSRSGVLPPHAAKPHRAPC